MARTPSGECSTAFRSGLGCTWTCSTQGVGREWPGALKAHCGIRTPHERRPLPTRARTKHILRRSWPRRTSRPRARPDARRRRRATARPGDAPRDRVSRRARDRAIATGPRLPMPCEPLLWPFRTLCYTRPNTHSLKGTLYGSSRLIGSHGYASHPARELWAACPPRLPLGTKALVPLSHVFDRTCEGRTALGPPISERASMPGRSQTF